MASAKDWVSCDPHVGFAQTSHLYEGKHNGGSSLLVPNPTSLAVLGHKVHGMVMFEDSDSSDSMNYQAGHPLFIFDSRNSPNSSSTFTFGTITSQPEESLSTLNFKASSDYSSSNPLMLNFEKECPNTHQMLSHGKFSADYCDTIFPSHQLHHPNTEYSAEALLLQEMNCFETPNYHKPDMNALKENKREDDLMLLCSEEMPGNGMQECREPGGSSHKRPCMVGDVLSSNRHCDGAHKKSKTKPVTSKDPQSLAAKNRRERISERLKILQDLVPNVQKLDLVTMLEKAISYVKFLELQVKVLSTDEFWPTHGGTVPNVAQIKEGIDVILSSHKDRTSSPK